MKNLFKMALCIFTFSSVTLPIIGNAVENDPALRAAEAHDLGVDVVEKMVKSFTEILFTPKLEVTIEHFESYEVRKSRLLEAVLNTDETVYREKLKTILGEIRALILKSSFSFGPNDFQAFIGGFNLALSNGKPRFAQINLLPDNHLAFAEMSFEEQVNWIFLPKLSSLFESAWETQSRLIRENGTPQAQATIQVRQITEGLNYWPFEKYKPSIGAIDRTQIIQNGKVVEGLASFPLDFTFETLRRATKIRVARAVSAALEKSRATRKSLEECGKSLLEKK